jgi:hypothetical protein
MEYSLTDGLLPLSKIQSFKSPDQRQLGRLNYFVWAGNLQAQINMYPLLSVNSHSPTAPQPPFSRSPAAAASLSLSPAALSRAPLSLPPSTLQQPV